MSDDINTTDVAWPSEWSGAFQHALTPDTRRDLFAAAALGGILANTDIYEEVPGSLARVAVRYADTLLAALDQPKGETP